MAGALTPIQIEVDRRHAHQSAALAIHDIYDAIVELVTNADDRYQLLETSGAVHIEIERHRRGLPSVIRVRDFADGMTADVMQTKLARIGGRVSGLERGKAVRGTNSRGAKDIAVLGTVTFRSIAGDGLYHKCQITPHLEFIPFESARVSRAHRKALGISRGTGTLVTIEVAPEHRVQLHDKMRRRLRDLVSLRSILSDPERTVILRDLQQSREDPLLPVRIDGHERVKVSFDVPGYPDAQAKLIISRAKKRFERGSQRSRLGGIVVRSRHAVHEATLCDPGLETDPHAAWFYGVLRCPYIDDLWNEFDECFEKRQDPPSDNPRPIVDPGRRLGLTREHPFTKALFGEVLRHLRPLVEEERKREESQRTRVESQATRRRLNRLEKAASKFIEEHHEQDDVSRDPDAPATQSTFRRKGYLLSPPFAQMIKGTSRPFWIVIRQEAYPELQVGTSVEIDALTEDISSDKRICGLEPHPEQEGVLRATWKVHAIAKTTATGIRARVGPIVAESAVEVLETEADRFRHVTSLQFSKRRYRIPAESRKKKIRLLAPINVAPRPTRVQVTCSDKKFRILGAASLRPKPAWGVALCDVGVMFSGAEGTATVTAVLEQHQATAELKGVQPKGAGLTIKLEDIDLKNQRYRWKSNVLEIAARHPSLCRYLGPKENGFPGQEHIHFRLLLAEIVAEAVATKLVKLNESKYPEEYDEADWDHYYADFTDYVTQFLPLAHKLQCPEVP